MKASASFAMKGVRDDGENAAAPAQVMTASGDGADCANQATGREAAWDWKCVIAPTIGGYSRQTGV